MTKDDVEFRIKVMDLMRALNQVLIDNKSPHDVTVNAFVGMLAIASCDSELVAEDYCRMVHRALRHMANKMTEPGHTTH